ncbi:CcoQ/FixQ family Cbb3-type cytochrome c oxidase assembly chaperone [Litoribacter ruber]|nr:CcoQ/FixQ family Cbb3-type cytochrome c oxidase assembly chaperone [Litoribacter ruber]
MDSIIGIEIYPMISLLIFFIFFTTLILWAFYTKKEFFSGVENLPLDEDGTYSETGNKIDLP